MDENREEEKEIKTPSFSALEMISLRSLRKSEREMDKYESDFLFLGEEKRLKNFITGNRNKLFSWKIRLSFRFILFFNREKYEHPTLYFSLIKNNILILGAREENDLNGKEKKKSNVSVCRL